MKPTLRLGLLGLLGTATVAVIWVLGHRQTVQQPLSFRPILDRATEAKAAVNQVGLLASKVSLQEEEALGSTLALQIEGDGRVRRGGEATMWLNQVAARLAAKGNLRRPGIPYPVALVDSPCINAFSIPGGHLYVTTGMLEFLQTEAEAAALLGHEMAHVDLGHCIARYQYELQAKKIGGEPLAAMGSLGAGLMLLGYQDEQELEADRWGMRLAEAAGYQPQAGEAMFQRLSEREPKDHPAKSIPVETAGAVLDGLEDYFATHPPGPMRIRNLEKAIREDQLDLAQGRYYLGRENRKQLKSRDQMELAGEFTQGGIIK